MDEMRSFEGLKNLRCTQWYSEGFPKRKTSSLPFLLSYGVHFHGAMSIDTIAHEKSDNEFAALMEKAKDKLFKNF